MNRSLINDNSNDDYYEALVESQTTTDKNNGTLNDPISLPVGSVVVVQQEDRGP